MSPGVLGKTSAGAHPAGNCAGLGLNAFTRSRSRFPCSGPRAVERMAEAGDELAANSERRSICVPSDLVFTVWSRSLSNPGGAAGSVSAALANVVSPEHKELSVALAGHKEANSDKKAPKFEGSPESCRPGVMGQDGASPGVPAK